jgi:serine/threonine protein kinase
VTAVILSPGQPLRGEQGTLFRVVEWAGEGSYARIYRGDGPDGPVALKLSKREVPGAADRLLREREAHSRLTHAAIPAFRDAGQIEGLPGAGPGPPWLARQWVEGLTLRQRLNRDRSLALVRTVPLLLRLADAVALIHARGWTHGDLRPDNILLEQGTHQAYLLDLGEARPNKCLAHLRPHASAPVDASPARDVCQLADLLAWCLTGIDPQIAPECLSRAAGYHPTAVQLWQEARGGRLASAAFRERLRRLAGQLGIRC